MRKNTARHLLHGLLDLLPILIIPIFSIYITNHEPVPISITAETEEIVDFNQQISPTNTIYNYYTTKSDELVEWDNVYINSGNPLVRYEYLKVNHIYYLRDIIDSYSVYQDEANTIVGVGLPRIRINGSYSNVNVGSSFRFTALNTYFDLSLASNYRQQYFYLTSSLQLFDLTQMYGVGNEPSVIDFENDFPLVYYPYNSSELVGINATQVLYNDTDIGSQYIYQLYHVTDKYFNMGNVFNLGNVYEWFNVNIFYGQSPFVMSIVYNIIVYEFVMDLLFLLYGLFMWFVDMLKRLMEKPLDSIK